LIYGKIINRPEKLLLLPPTEFYSAFKSKRATGFYFFDYEHRSVTKAHLIWLRSFGAEADKLQELFPSLPGANAKYQ